MVLTHIAVRFNADQTLHRFKAIPNHVFEIHAFHAASFASISATMIVTLKAEEESPFSGLADPAFVHRTDIIGQQGHLDLPEPMRSKYITVGVDGTDTSGLIIIYYRFAKASIDELIWEFAAKKR